MARGGTGYGTIDFLEKCVSYALTSDMSKNIVRCSPSSRTDAGVHALNNAIMIQTPSAYSLKTDLINKKQQIDTINQIINDVNPDSMKVLDYVHVVPGFCARRHVSYRMYSYRLAIARDYSIYEEHKNQPSLVSFSEKDYAWILPPGFNIEKANKACEMFKGHKNVASFYKHPERERKREMSEGMSFQSTWRNFLLVNMTKGAPKKIENELFDYININIISRSFVREQIRKMMTLIVGCAYDTMNPSIIDYMFANPRPSNFQNLKLKVAPPEGLHLAQIVYDPGMFTYPVPYYKNAWDSAEWNETVNIWYNK
uniref:tRNA pseudouridine synthase n=1 Tax=Rhabditophanes sp. KR3021 TaxID=114890 RepID=A0AC35UGB2_9BILA